MATAIAGFYEPANDMFDVLSAKGDFISDMVMC
jgi:hypothetical protein